MTDPTRAELLGVLELAVRAPSVHNSQPWRWRIVGEAILELYADRTRQLAVADAEGRNLALSCGAALHHAVEAAEVTGLSSEVERLPVADSDLMARVRLAPGRRPADADERRRALESRCTDRRRFTSWPVPDARLHALADVGSGSGACVVPITDVTARFRVELLLERAMVLQAADGRFRQEQDEWVARGAEDGIPGAVAAPPRAERRREPANRFRLRTDPGPRSGPDTRMVESSDGLLAICTAADDERSWLQAGETMSAVWLRATQDGLSIVPLSQAVEVAETRRALREEVFGATSHPQLFLRVGWQEIARTTLPRTPRRPMEDVLMP